MAAPEGLVVRRRHDLVDGGPFRGAQVPSRTEITYQRPGASGHTTARIVVVLAPLLAVAAAIAGLVADPIWNGFVAGLIALFAMAVAELRGAEPWDREPTLAITPEHLLHDGKRLLLADVRRIDLTRGRDGHDVCVEAATGRVVVATTRSEAQATFMVAEIDTAYRAFLRRRTDS